jgi:hypothetical protein
MDSNKTTNQPTQSAVQPTVEREVAMTPEEHRDAASSAMRQGKDEIATYHATMGVLEAMLQIDFCGHGTRGFCKDCVRNDFLSYPISVREVSGS